jgi:lysozyme
VIKPSTRQSVGGLGIGAALLVSVMMHEGYTDKAVIPVPGDVPTIGVGRTEGVHMGDKTEPVREMMLLLKNLDKYGNGIKACINVPLYQYELDAFVSLAYNIGINAFCNSTLVKKLNAGDYSGACEQIMIWDKFKGKPLKGLTNRRNKEYRTCRGSA